MPDLICVRVELFAPTTTFLETDFPSWRTSTVVVFALTWSADVGTVSTLETEVTATFIAADAPLSSFAFESFNETVTA